MPERLAGHPIRIPPAAGEVLRFAAAELARYWRQMTGCALEVVADAQVQGAAIAMGRAPAPAPGEQRAYVMVIPQREGAVLAGESEAGALRAVYRFLEELGCRWSFHGPEEERVPALPPGELEVLEIVENPRFRVRAYTSDLHTWHYLERHHLEERLPADRCFIDWMAKTGANAFFFIRHPFDTQLSVPELLPEFRKRGIAAEYGGHVIPLLLPRHWRAAHPEYFPQDANGNRTDTGNVCASNAEALRHIARGAFAWAQEHPETSALHVWGADLWGGGWCRCGGCAALSPQDQSLRVCNAVAGALEELCIEIPIYYLAYHDTVDADLSLRPAPNVWVEFAPRERCYGHAIADPSCAVNRRYCAALSRYIDLFQGRTRVFEYYGDSILFCGCAVPLPTVIREDLDHYCRSGVREVSMLQFGTHSLWAYPLNFLSFAAASWGDAEPPWDAYCARLGDATQARAYFAALETAMRAVVTYGDLRRPPRSCGQELLPAIERARLVVGEWAARFRKGGSGIRRPGDFPQGDPLEQAPLLEYTETLLQGVARELSDFPGAAAEARSLYAHALEKLAQVAPRNLGLWGRLNLPVIHRFYDVAAQREP